MTRSGTASCALMIFAAGLLAESATARAAGTVVVALGASSTAGKGVDPGATYPAQLEAMLRSDGYDVAVVNAGRNGDTSSGMLERLDDDVASGTTLVVLQTGTNDARRPGHDDDIAAIVGRLEARGIKVVLFETRLMRDLRDGYSQRDGHHLTAEGYRILASRLRPLVETALCR